jgi:micrococcal nuclease
MFARRRRFRRRPRRIWLVVILIAGLALLRCGHDRWHGEPRPAREPPLTEGDYTVLRVVDGDTLDVALQRSPPGTRRREIRVRLLGIDCPESVKLDYPVEPWAREAAEFTSQFVSAGVVRLRFDKRRLDRYDRYLAYVFVADKMLNEELVRAGLARLSPFPGDSESMARRLRVAEQEAVQQARGIQSGKLVRPSQKP